MVVHPLTKVCGTIATDPGMNNRICEHSLMCIDTTLKSHNTNCPELQWYEKWLRACTIGASNAMQALMYEQASYFQSIGKCSERSTLHDVASRAVPDRVSHRL